MSSERREDSYYGDYSAGYYHPHDLRAEYNLPQRNGRHYEDRESPRAQTQSPREHHHARQTSQTPKVTPYSHPASPESHSGQYQRHPDFYDHGGREEETRETDGGHSRSSTRPSPQNRKWKAKQRHRHQDHWYAYEGGATDALYQSHGQPRTWEATEEMDGKRVNFQGEETGVHRGHPRSKKKSKSGYPDHTPSSSYYGAWQAQQGNTQPNTDQYQEHYDGDGAAEACESEWEAGIHNMLPSQIDMAKGKRYIQQN